MKNFRFDAICTITREDTPVGSLASVACDEESS